jgi:hypothetical protein
MTAAAIIQLSLSLLQLVLGSLKQNSATQNLDTIIQGIEAAIANLQAVQGTPVTYDQLESLRVEPKW